MPRYTVAFPTGPCVRAGRAEDVRDGRPRARSCWHSHRIHGIWPFAFTTTTCNVSRLSPASVLRPFARLLPTDAFSFTSCGPSLAHPTATAAGAATCDLHHIPVAQTLLADAQNFRRQAWLALARLHPVFAHLGVCRFNSMPFVAQTNVTPLSLTATLPPRPYSSATSNLSPLPPLQTRPIPTVSPAPRQLNSSSSPYPPSWTRPLPSSQDSKIRNLVTKSQW